MTPQRTVCQVLHTLGMGGAEVLAARLASQLRDEYRFVFVCLDDLNLLGAQLRAQGFRVEVLARHPGVDWRCAMRLARLLEDERVDVLHAHQYAPFFYSLVARLRTRRPRVIFTEHGRDYPDYPRRKRMLANRLMLERRDRVVAVGAAVRDALIRNEGFPAARVDVIYNGIDLAPHRHARETREAIRRELGAQPTDLLVFQVARLNYLKDHPTAVRAMERVIARCPTARLILIGEGEERRRIEEEIARRHLGAHVQLLGQRVDVSRLLPAADLFLLTSISEGIPLTLIEAMAAGLPVVATSVGGVPEVVQQTGTGLLAPAGHDEALADAIVRLAGDPRLRHAMGERARDRAANLFSEPQMHDGYRRLYREALAG